MTDELSPRIEELFHGALALDPEQRAAFIREVCETDRASGAQLRNLLAHDESGGDFLEEPILGRGLIRRSAEESRDETAAPLASAGETSERTRVGLYELRRLIGAGGMGSIYFAERVEPDFRREVAVKLIKQGMDTSAILSRFIKERQVLARLDHPNIARLLDGGSTDDGLPYFVMEYIDGEPIDSYCDQHSLSTRSRLELFLAVCSAVHYSHQNLIVHRDVKPGNILVTREGVPKLLDFGIAKLLDPDSSMAVTTERTTRFLTPDYASPEQIRGEPITTATDIYSLGLVLYELLTGHRPYAITTNLGPKEIERVVCEEQPVKPSTVIQRVEEVFCRRRNTKIALTPDLVSRARDGRPEKLRRQLVGDVDNIVLMALRKEPERRYASAEQFAEDIRRHLRGLPVIARKDTIRYRTAKFVGRNKVSFVAGAVVLLAILTGVGATLVQSRRVQEERDRALANLKRAREAENLAERRRSWLSYLFSREEAADVGGKEITLRDVLDQAAGRIVASAAGRPEETVRVIEDVAGLYVSLGLYASAASYQKKLLELHTGPLGSDPLVVARLRRDLAASLIGSADYVNAARMLETALQTQRDHSAESSDVASTLRILGYLQWRKGDFERSLSLLRESVEMNRRVGEPHPELVHSLHSLVAVLLNAGRAREAESFSLEALELARGLYPGEHGVLAGVLTVVGGVEQDLGRYAAAEGHYREALAMMRRLYGEDHPDVVTVKMELAVLLKDMDRYDAAESLCREALERRQRFLGERHTLMPSSWWHLTQILSDRGDFPQAEESCRKSLELYRELFEPGYPQTSRVRTLLGYILVKRGRYAEAEGLLRESLAQQREAQPEHWETAKTASILGAALTGLGRYEEAERLLKESYPAVRADRGPRHRRTREALERLLVLYEAWGKPEKAARYRTELESVSSVTDHAR